MPYKDPAKQRAAQAKHYKRNKHLYKTRFAKRRQDMRHKVAELKISLGCSRCPENHPAALEFHHVEDNKVATISEMIAFSRSWEVILAEIKKCVLLCANCHRKDHWNKRHPMLLTEVESVLTGRKPGVLPLDDKSK